jgi:hypothetical protein
MIARLIALLLLATLVTLVPPAPAGAQVVGDVFRRVSPSVVVIRSRGRDVAESGLVRFGEVGSGVLISADGKVMTAAHVVQAMDEINVEFIGGDRARPRRRPSPAADPLLQLERARGRQGRPLRQLERGPRGRPGAVGRALWLSYSLSVGYVSARWAPNTVYRPFPAEFLQTDATITGNSRPMFNLAGEVVGIVSHNIRKGGGSEGLFVDHQHRPRPLPARRSIWSGLEGHTPSRATSPRSSTPPARGLPDQMRPSPAESGIRGGNRTAVIDGQTPWSAGTSCSRWTASPSATSPITSARDHMQLAPGATITVTVLRAGCVLNLMARRAVMGPAPTR